MTFVACPCLRSADRYSLRFVGVRDIEARCRVARDACGIILHRGLAYRIDYFFPGIVLQQISKAPAPIIIGTDRLLFGLYAVGVQYDRDARRSVRRLVTCPCLCSADRHSLRCIGVRDVVACRRVTRDACGIILHRGLAYRIDYFFPRIVLRQISKAPAPIVFGADCLLRVLFSVGVQYDSDARGSGALVAFVACPRLRSADRHSLRRIGVRDVVAVDHRGIVLHFKLIYRVDYFLPGAVLRQILKAPAPIAIGIGDDFPYCLLLPIGEQSDFDARRTGVLMARVIPRLCSVDRHSLGCVGVRDIKAGGIVRGDH